ncbi:MAG: sensor histidine kinase N-terminal domain-containing protein [Candidatus Obscuribacterales bacterium]|nr:sensor histidine kinase N-terminal domain-containing protein [Candidatus Obscuribacterales bacterium]
MKRLSIRKQLLTLLIPFLFGLWIASAVVSFWFISIISGETFDKDLINSADSVVGRLRVKGDKVVVDLPPAALAILKHDESDKFYYCVIGSNGQRISGDTGLPPPSDDLKVGVPKFASERIAEKTVRVAEIKVSVDEADQTVIVQVAETTNGRSRFQQKMLLSIAAPQLLVILVGLFAVWYGITKILTPLRSLQQQIADRSQLDLRALSDGDAPQEVYPLVKTLNHLLSRLREEIKAHQRFIANAAHQLRTPLAGLKTYSSIGSEMTEVKDLQMIVHELDQGIDRASRMVAQLLALARTDSGEAAVIRTTSHVDLNFLVSDLVAELIEQAILKDLELTYVASTVSATIDCETDGLRHLIVNLVENALHYTPRGGRIVVEVRNEGTNIVLSVTDSGPGIPAEEREKVFERFYRVVGTGGNGSGLGLSIVREVANAHNARVSIETAAGGTGTVVIVEFPIASRSQESGFASLVQG